jgi:ABC-type nitrate/sulfonate/bicarbonate transport system substrate-binding protein
MARGLAQQLVVRKDRVKTVADLKGARWAVDGIGALSHNLATLVVEAMQTDVEWVVAGPPPERVAALLNGTADAALLRVEEAAVLARTHDAELAVLLGFSDLKRLAPNQPHGVLSTTEAFESGNPDVCAKLARGLILASRSLHDSQASFEQAVETHVRHVRPTAEEVADIWRQEHDCKGFAVNGGMSAEHWKANQRVFELTNPGVVTPEMKDVLATRFVVEALQHIGTGEYGFDPCPAGEGFNPGPR